LLTAAPALLCAVLLAQARPAAAQDTGPVHDAPFVPSPPVTVEEMLRLAGVGPGDLVYDLGSGDGRVVIAAAARFGARGVGIEIDGALVAKSRANAAQAGVADRVRFLRQDLFATDLGEATVVTLYLSPNLNLRLRPALLRLRPGTRVVSHSSDLGDWRPDRKTSVRKDVLLWIVPAPVAGRWRAGRLELELAQRYQEVTARARLDGARAEVWETRLEGDRLTFVIVEDPGGKAEAALYFEGRVRGDLIEGSFTRGAGGARNELVLRRDVARSGVGAAAEEMALGLLHEVLARALIGEVEAVLVHQHGLLLEPLRPGLFRDALPDALAELARVGREIHAFGLAAELYTLQHSRHARNYILLRNTFEPRRQL